MILFGFFSTNGKHLVSSLPAISGDFKMMPHQITLTTTESPAQELSENKNNPKKLKKKKREDILSEHITENCCAMAMGPQKGKSEELLLYRSQG